MQTIKPEDRPKAIVLGIATVVVLMYVVVSTMMRLNGANNPGGTTPTPTTTPAVTPASVATTMPQDVNPSAPGDTISPNTGSNVPPPMKLDMYSDAMAESSTRDPFTPIAPVHSTRTFAANHIATPIITPMRTSTIRPLPGGFNALPGSGGPAVPHAAQQTPTLDVRLAGVIAGPSAVAVLHVGDQSIDTIVGDKLPFGMKLAKITEEGIYLNKSGKMYFVAVGHSLRTEPADLSGIANPAPASVPAQPSEPAPIQPAGPAMQAELQPEDRIRP